MPPEEGKYVKLSEIKMVICEFVIYLHLAVQKLAGHKNIQVINGQLLLSVNWRYLGQFTFDSGFFN